MCVRRKWYTIHYCTHSLGQIHWESFQTLRLYSIYARRKCWIPSVFFSTTRKNHEAGESWSSDSEISPTSLSLQHGGGNGRAQKKLLVLRVSCVKLQKGCKESFSRACAHFCSLGLSGVEVGIWTVNGVRLEGGGRNRALVVAADITHPVLCHWLLWSSHSQTVCARARVSAYVHVCERERVRVCVRVWICDQWSCCVLDTIGLLPILTP